MGPLSQWRTRSQAELISELTSKQIVSDNKVCCILITEFHFVSQLDSVYNYRRSGKQDVEEELINCSVMAVASRINRLVVDHCHGCFTSHPSQRQHDCLMLEAGDRVKIYHINVYM